MQTITSVWSTILSIWKTSLQVRQACSNVRTKSYDLFRHIYLVQTFSVVYITADGDAVDAHVDFVKCGGYSEHALFIAGLVSKEGFQKLPKGPLHSQPVKRVMGKAGWLPNPAQGIPNGSLIPNP